MFSAERTLDSLTDAGYQNGFEELSLSQRVTHPGSHGFPDATFDFIFAKDLNSVAAHGHSDQCIGSLACDAQFPFALTFIQSADARGDKLRFGEVPARPQV